MNNSSVQLCDDLLLFMGRIKHGLIELAEERDLTMVQLFALFTINRQGHLAMGQVAEVLHCDASNVTGIVDRLVGHGLVLRKESEYDRRTKTLHLTAKGKEVVEDLMKAVPEKVGCDKLSSEERRTFRTITQKISL